MNKKKKVIIGVLAVILVAAVGYALFSDTLTINGTATAQGNFDLTYSCELDSKNGSATGNCSVKDNTVTTTSTLSKPSDSAIYKVTVTNDGSIPAVLKTVTSPNNYTVDYNSSGDEGYIDLETGLGAQYTVCPDGNINTCSGAVYGDAAVEAANITIQPGESIVIGIAHGWFDSEELGLESQPEIPAEGASINYNLTFGFEQITS